MSLRLAFMGTPAFAVASLDALIEAGHEVRAVYCQPPRPSGRGHRLTPSPVQQVAERHGLSVHTPKSLRGEAEQAVFRSLDLDAAIVAAYGLILPQPILDAPRLGCINVHASLLPRWRGAAPIQRAILAGDDRTGVTIMGMEAGLDTGPMLLAEAIPITDETTGGALHDNLASLGAALLPRALEGVANGSIRPRPQPDTGVTYAAKIGREDARLDWRLPAADLERRVRAFAPAPGAWFEHGGERIRVGAATVEPVSGPTVDPGTLLDEGGLVACGAAALRLERLQHPGRAMLPAEDYLRGRPLPAGTRLQTPCDAPDPA